MKTKILLLAIAIFSFSQAYSQSKIKIACVGNSITQGPGRDHQESYPLQLQEIIGDDYLVKNFGVSGRTLLKKGDKPYWNEPQFKQVKRFSPDILIIKLGTNDSKPQNWIHKKDFKQDYLDLISAFKTAMPQNSQVYICIPVPVAKDNWGINEKVMIEEIRPLLLEIANETGAKIIDLHSPLKEHPDLLPDGVHPNKEGLGIMAQTIATEITSSR